jgi:FAD/FMN-containing dehydrogenase
VLGIVGQLGGSISAEHGVGTDKLAYLGLTRSDAEIAVMRRIKRALDPNGILNPGKLLTLEGQARKTTPSRPQERALS